MQRVTHTTVGHKAVDALGKAGIGQHVAEGAGLLVFAARDDDDVAGLSIVDRELQELMGFMPIDMIFETAPHLWGKTPEEAEHRLTLTKLIERLPHDTMRDLIGLLKRMTPSEPSADAVATNMGEKPISSLVLPALVESSQLSS